jgi:hypothetical protein
VSITFLDKKSIAIIISVIYALRVERKKITSPLLGTDISRVARGLLGTLIAKTDQDQAYNFSIKEIADVESMSRERVASILSDLEDRGHLDRYASEPGRNTHRFRVKR